MDVICEEGAQQRLLHSRAVPGLYVYGKPQLPLGLALRMEAARFEIAFPMLPMLPATANIVVEHVKNAPLTVPGQTASLFEADLAWPPAQFALACELLWASIGHLEKCYHSFPDPAYDYAHGEKNPDWQPTSGQEAMEGFARQLRRHMEVYGLPWQEGLSWQENFAQGFEALRVRADFLENRLVHTPQGFWCAGRWLRSLTEQCQWTGRQLYRLGVAAFGRQSIADPFCFETLAL